MIEKINDVLGLQKIEEFIDQEDEDIGSGDESEDSENLEESVTSEESGSRRTTYSIGRKC